MEVSITSSSEEAVMKQVMSFRGPTLIKVQESVHTAPLKNSN